MTIAIVLAYVVMAIGFYRVLSLAVDRPRWHDLIPVVFWPIFLLTCGTIFPLSVMKHYWNRRKGRR